MVSVLSGIEKISDNLGFTYMYISGSTTYTVTAGLQGSQAPLSSLRALILEIIPIFQEVILSIRSQKKEVAPYSNTTGFINMAHTYVNIPEPKLYTHII